MKSNLRKNGFTLIEVLLSIVLIGIIAGIGIPVYENYNIRSNLDTSANIIIQTLRRAQILSQSVAGDSPWGLKIQTGSVTLFKGASYSGRDNNFDELFNIPSNITPSGLTEIIFNKFSGTPIATGNITLQNTTINETRNIVINEKGTVSY